MYICDGEKRYRCGKIKTDSIGRSVCMSFSITECVPYDDIKSMLGSTTFYFYDEVIGGRLPDTLNRELTGLKITYNENRTCQVIIKLT